jgi:hypothetical protein
MPNLPGFKNLAGLKAKIFFKGYFNKLSLILKK